MRLGVCVCFFLVVSAFKKIYLALYYSLVFFF